MNIHILQTSQPSRLLQCLEVFELLDKEWLSPLGNVNRNIYITNDEKPKEGDWCLDKFNQRWKLDDKKLIAFDIEGIKRFSTDNILGHECKKIIITTDQELIKDGIQAIDDEFLEWFVKNQSCEEVEVINDTLTVGEMSKLPLGARNHKYKTIIPKEEPKRKIDTCYNFDMEIGCVQDICRCEQEEPKQDEIMERFIANTKQQKTLEEHYLSIPKPLVDVSRQNLDNNPDLVKQESLVEKMKPILEQWQKDMDKSLQEPKQREMFLMNANTIIDTRKTSKEINFDIHIKKEQMLDLEKRIVIEKVSDLFKQETIERISLMEIELNHTKTLLASCEKALEDSFKKQDKKRYSEEEVIAFGEFIFKHSLLTHAKGIKSLFEQFKKK
jgi:hypothetical protein